MSKLTTADCVKAINEHDEKGDWKRVSKNRVMHDKCDDFCYLREFASQPSDEVPKLRTAYIWTTEDEILEIRVLTQNMDIKSALDAEENWEILEEEVEIGSIPICKCDGSWESLDTENLEVEDFDDKRYAKVTLFLGGDWQKPIRADFVLMSDNRLYCVFPSIEKNPYDV